MVKFLQTEAILELAISLPGYPRTSDVDAKWVIDAMEETVELSRR